jgi:hypothetical protein
MYEKLCTLTYSKEGKKTFPIDFHLYPDGNAHPLQHFFHVKRIISMQK